MNISTTEPTLRIATTEDDRAAAYRLRYELYVEDQGLFGDQADHERRWLRDEYDDTSTILLAEDQGEVVGTARMTFGDTTTFSQESREDYDFARFEGVLEDSDFSVVTRLVVRPSHRGTPLGTRLLHEGFALAAERGAELVLGSCELHLINHYWKLAFRPFGELSSHPTNGVLIRIAVVLGDLEHVRRIGSPMTSALERRTRPNDNLPAILERIERGLALTSEARHEPAAYSREVMRRVTSSETDTPTFLETLTPEEATELLKKSHILKCNEGDTLVLEGHRTRMPYILLAGSLEVRRQDDHRRRLSRPGTLVGEVAFMASMRRTSDIVAGPDGAHVLALNDGTLRQLLAGNGPLAAKFLAFTARELCEKLVAHSQPRAVETVETVETATRPASRPLPHPTTRPAARSASTARPAEHRSELGCRRHSPFPRSNSFEGTGQAGVDAMSLEYRRQLEHHDLVVTPGHRAGVVDRHPVEATTLPGRPQPIFARPNEVSTAVDPRRGGPGVGDHVPEQTPALEFGMDTPAARLDHLLLGRQGIEIPFEGTIAVQDRPIEGWHQAQVSDDLPAMLDDRHGRRPIPRLGHLGGADMGFDLPRRQVRDAAQLEHLGEPRRRMDDAIVVGLRNDTRGSPIRIA